MSLSIHNARRPQMKRAREEDIFLQDEPALKTQHIAPKTYGNATIGGNAGVVQGDNRGSITNQHGDHYYYLPPPEEEKPNEGRAKADKILQERFNTLPASLAFDNMGVRLRNVDPALSATCRWLRSHETFVSWLKHDPSSEPRGFLWIKGKPGSGKSTIMRETLLWVTRRFPEQSVISYFFDARSPYRLAKSTLGMYQSLLYQLLSVQAEIFETNQKNRELLKACLKEFSSKVKSSQTENWFETEIQNFIIGLADAQQLPALVIFIDALDEDDGDDIQQMVAFFEDLQQRVLSSGGNLRICLSSRHYPHVTIRGEPIVLEEQPGHGQDISEYVYTRLLGDESREKSELREKIIKKAAGVFLWVILMIQMLNHDFNCGKGLKSMQRELDRAPDKVQDLFKAILAKEGENKEECITLLKWILLAQRSLSPTEVCAALRHIKHGDIESMSSLDDEEVSRYLLYCSRGLVERTKAKPPTVQFVHETVRELLLSTTILTNDVMTPPAAIPTALVEQAEICHGMIAESCLTYLHEVEAQQDPVERSRYPLVSYAAQHWWKHLEKTNDSNRMRSLRLISKFLADHANRVHWEKLFTGQPLGNAFRVRRSIAIPFYKSIDQPLCRVVLANVPKLVRECIDAGVDINHGGELMTALSCAVVRGNTVMVKVLLELGADPNAVQHYSALGLAVEIGDITQVRMLLEAGALVNVIENGWTPLTIAARLGYEEIVHVLLDRGADINLSESSANPLVCAASSGRKNVVKVLIERGADVGHRNCHRTPLSAALADAVDCREIVALLLDAGAPIDYGGEGYDSPLEIAKSKHHEDIVKLLLARGARRGTFATWNDSSAGDQEKTHHAEDSIMLYGRYMGSHYVRLQTEAILGIPELESPSSSKSPFKHRHRRLDPVSKTSKSKLTANS